MKSLAITFLILLSSCMSGSDSRYLGTTKPRHPSNELWINGGNEAQTMDPSKIDGEPEINLTMNMFSRLVQTNPQTGEIEPSLAKTWDISSNGLEYTFHLRDAQWSDGTAITANDIVYSWKRLINPKTGAVNSSMADVIEGAKEFRTGKRSSESIQIQAKDPKTLWVRLKKPVTYFLQLIDYAIFSPLPEHTIQKFAKGGHEDQWTKPENIVVSGPFKIIEDHFKQYKILEKNPFYFDATHIQLEKVKSLVIESYKTDMNAYQTGEHDWSCCNSIPSESIRDLRDKRDFHEDPYLAVYFLMLNTNKGPLHDARVRRALSLSIDRQSIVKNITRGGQTPTRDLIPPRTMGYDGIGSSIFDVETAKQLLASAGFPNGNRFPKLSLKFNTTEIHKLIAETVQQMWKQNLGIDIQLVNEEWSVLLDDHKSGNFEISRRAWIADYLDPYTFLDVLSSTSTNNKTGWKNKEYDKLLTASSSQPDTSKRYQLFQSAEKILADEQPFIPLYVYTRVYMKKPYVRGFWPNQLNRHEWKYMWIDDQWKPGDLENSN